MFLAKHIETYGLKGRGSASYLLSTTCEVFIELMGEKKQALKKQTFILFKRGTSVKLQIKIRLH